MELTRLGRFINNNQIYINAGVFGFISHILFNYLGVLHNNEGVEYYAEVIYNTLECLYSYNRNAIYNLWNVIMDTSLIM